MAPSDKKDRELADRLGIEPSPRLVQALTHPSASSAARPDNQRLEFLGDRVLGLVIAEMLAERFPKEAEGKLAPRLNALVRKDTCAEVAASISLGDHMRLGRSENTSGGRRKTSLLGDAMEAVIAAVYLDRGLPAARDLILRLWAEQIDRQRDAPLDAKTRLQEWAQGLGMAPPVYEETGRTGPDHAPVFKVLARLEDGRKAEGSDRSKRTAEMAAAAALLDIIGTPND